MCWCFTLSDNLTFNPIQSALHWAGRIAIGFFVLSLAVTPLLTITGYSPLAVLRRPLGLAAFYYATAHLLLYIGLDQRFDWQVIFQSILIQPFIWIGLTGLFVLLILGITAIKSWMPKLGKHWKKIQRLAYVGIFVVLIHYAMARKGNILTLQGDIAIPLVLAGLTLVLLALRLKFIRRWFIKRRGLG